MAKRLAVIPPPAARVVHYVDPSTPAERAFPLSPAQLAAKQRRDQAAYARWKARQAAIAERDRKLRRFWLGFGAIIALAVLTALLVAGWLVWTVAGLGALAIPVLIAGVAVAALGGHRCITVVQHWH